MNRTTRIVATTHRRWMGLQFACVSSLLLLAPASTADTQDTPAASAPRMWLEVEPARFESQPLVTEMLYLRELNANLQGTSSDSPCTALFESDGERWLRTVKGKQVRPLAFAPEPLQELVDVGGPGRLFWRAAGEPSSLLDIIEDLEQIWSPGMREAVADYATAFDMLGRFTAGVAEVREGQGRLTGRLVLLAASEGDAKGARAALTVASGLGRMAAATAVKSGQMTAAEGAALDAVLGSIDTRVDGARLTVHLSIDAALLQPILR